jgi:hypothetical protein
MLFQGVRFCAPVYSLLLSSVSLTSEDIVLTINRGYDLFRTAGAGKDFSVNPIPGDFFDRGSSPFSGLMILQGSNLADFVTPAATRFALPQSSAAEPENAVDCVISRNSDIELPTVGASSTIEVQMVHLALNTGQHPLEIRNSAGQI